MMEGELQDEQWELIAPPLPKPSRVLKKGCYLVVDA
jgi:hypothetical protein